MLAALGSLNLGSDFLSMLAQMGGMKLAADDIRFLTGPVVVHGNAWQDIVPKWVIEQARAERAEIVFGQSNLIVGPSELVAVMMPATMEHPLHHDMVEVYFWAVCHAMARHTGKTPKDFAKQLGDFYRLPSVADVTERSGRYWNDYSALAYEIRRKVIGHAGPIERFPSFEEYASGKRSKVAIEPPDGLANQSRSDSDLPPRIVSPAEARRQKRRIARANQLTLF